MASSVALHQCATTATASSVSLLSHPAVLVIHPFSPFLFFPFLLFPCSAAPQPSCRARHAGAHLQEARHPIPLHKPHAWNHRDHPASLRDRRPPRARYWTQRIKILAVGDVIDAKHSDSYKIPACSGAVVLVFLITHNLNRRGSLSLTSTVRLGRIEG